MNDGRHRLPVHGFVLAGGKSSRMGRDKALLEVGGRAMVQIAVEKLSEFCADVSIVGNRDDLLRFAPVVTGERAGCGPAAGIESGLRACAQPWALFMPVDTPLVPANSLYAWALHAVESGHGSYLRSRSGTQPSFCVLQADALAVVHGELDRGTRRLVALWDSIGLESYPFDADERYLSNVNTPEEFSDVLDFSSQDLF